MTTTSATGAVNFADMRSWGRAAALLLVALLWIAGSVCLGASDARAQNGSWCTALPPGNPGPACTTNPGGACQLQWHMQFQREIGAPAHADIVDGRPQIQRFHTRTDNLNLTNILDHLYASQNQSFWYTATGPARPSDPNGPHAQS